MFCRKFELNITKGPFREKSPLCQLLWLANLQTLLICFPNGAIYGSETRWGKILLEICWGGPWIFLYVVVHSFSKLVAKELHYMQKLLRSECRCTLFKACTAMHSCHSFIWKKLSKYFRGKPTAMCTMFQPDPMLIWDWERDICMHVFRMTIIYLNSLPSHNIYIP